MKSYCFERNKRLSYSKNKSKSIAHDMAKEKKIIYRVSDNLKRVIVGLVFSPLEQSNCQHEDYGCYHCNDSKVNYCSHVVSVNHDVV